MTTRRRGRSNERLSTGLVRIGSKGQATRLLLMTPGGLAQQDARIIVQDFLLNGVIDGVIIVGWDVDENGEVNNPDSDARRWNLQLERRFKSGPGVDDPEYCEALLQYKNPLTEETVRPWYTIIDRASDLARVQWSAARHSCMTNDSATELTATYDGAGGGTPLPVHEIMGGGYLLLGNDAVLGPAGLTARRDNASGPVRGLVKITGHNLELAYALDSDGHIIATKPIEPPTYTVATLPSATTFANCLIKCSDGDDGSPCLAYAQDAVWVRISFGAQVSA